MVQNIMGRVYVGIVSYNSLDDLPACVQSLQAQIYPDFQIMILDNASHDDSAKWVRAAGLHLIANSENVGFARAHNLILRQCSLGSDDFYMPLNPDVVLHPGYIAALVRGIAAHSAGWAIGKLTLTNQPDLLYSIGHGIRRDGYFFNIGYHQSDQGQYETPLEIFGAPGAASLISAHLIADVAPTGELFDADMFLYAEDTDLDWRARRAGWHCWYIPDAKAAHRGSKPGTVLRTQAIANRYLSVLKNAYWIDLIGYNLPRIALHTVFRLIVTPRLGLILLTRLLRYSFAMIRKRTPTRLKRTDFLVWCYRTPDTTQPIQWATRLKAFFTR
jgi:GT2 family glycosyltransferase